MKFIKKHPMIMIAVGVIGISLSSIFVKLSTAPSAVTALFRLVWTVLLMSPSVLFKKDIRKELFGVNKRSLVLSVLSGVFLAIHFTLWFESLLHTSVASSTTLVCTEVIWVSLGYCIFLKGKLSFKAIIAIAAVFSTILGHSIFSWCLKYFSPSFVSASKLLEPVVAALIAIPVFAEYPKPLTIIGGVIILLSVWYYSTLEKS